MGTLNLTINTFYNPIAQSGILGTDNSNVDAMTTKPTKSAAEKTGEDVVTILDITMISCVTRILWN